VATRNGATGLFALIATLGKKQFVSFPLMVSFTVIMSGELG
jgi:hypothetical protein